MQYDEILNGLGMDPLDLQTAFEETYKEWVSLPSNHTTLITLDKINEWYETATPKQKKLIGKQKMSGVATVYLTRDQRHKLEILESMINFDRLSKKQVALINRIYVDGFSSFASNLMGSTKIQTILKRCMVK